MSQPLFTFRQVPTVAELLSARGVAIADVMRDAGFTETSTTEITAPLSKVQKLLELAAERLDAPVFGLDLADKIPQGAYGVTEFVVRSSPTVRHALAAMCELAPLINPALDMRYVADQLGCEVRFAYAGNRDALGDILNEYTVAYIAKQFAVILQRPLPLARAWFAHGRKQGAEEVSRRLGCPVGFQAADCGFAVAADTIAFANPAGNEALYKFLLDQAHTQLQNIGKNDVITQVTRVIEARISDADLSAATIAQALALSQRTLQRQLTDAGTSYRDLLASIRRRRRAELERAGLADADIAPRLGFASAKTMRRSLDDTGADEPAPDDAGG
ncbi:MAG TPA: AraC family transcriptional regulator ligand-binding domain-containing protein [Kofleriaceae bacterium]|jgi:AraC-like DNA-binding protein|nr:AraC family transcriptional regulator ligand-binding domain-containing protein [Kofleriaceae bacterium]